MAETIYTGTVKKRVNSTLQPTLSTTYSVLLKNGCSIDNPVFYLSASGFSDNYVKWNDRYYYVTDITYETNTRTAVSCTLDVLATYKSDILASTQFVSYSSVSGGTWLPDTRIPTLKSTNTAKSTASLSSIFGGTGFYVLSTIGKDGSSLYALGSRNQLKTLVANIQTWQDNDIDAINNSIPSAPTTAVDETDALLKVGEMIRNVQEASTQSSFIGNAFGNAPNCIRSCIWVPFLMTPFVEGGTEQIFLGNYDTGITAYPIVSYPVHNSVSVSIPWRFTDWRRATNESVYLYLPLVGMVQVSGDSITHVNTLTVKYSATATDGVICYEVIAGDEIIGTYGSQCSANYPLGINQQASAGEVFTTMVGGIEKMVNSAIHTSISPLSSAAGIAGMALNMGLSAYEVANTMASTHVSCIGGIGGGAGVGLDLNIVCYTVSHDLATSPLSMQATMGVPTMKPLTLSSCSGYCQCTNAHVAADAESGMLNLIDSFLNSGFYIE